MPQTPSLQKTSPHKDPAPFRSTSLGMDTRVLFALKQGPRSLEHHIREFSACAQDSDLPDIILIDIFCDGINQPLQTQLRREGPRSSLSCFLEFALTIGSLFTVGVAEEDHNAAPCHKMAADPESQNSPAKPESALTRPAKPESPARMATTPADAPLWPGLMTSVLDPPLVSVRAAGIPRFVAEPALIRELAESAPEPAPIRELAESAPEPAPIRELAESAPEPAPIRELAESAQLSFVSAGPAQLSFVSAGPAQLSFVSAGPAQLSFVSAGPAQLNNASAGSVQFYRAPKRVRAT